MKYNELGPEDFSLIPIGSKVNARILELEFKQDVEVLIFSEKKEVFGCLMPIESDSTELPRINGLDIRYEIVRTKDNVPRGFVLLECRFKDYLPHFTQIIKDVLEQFDNGSEELLKVLIKVISKWKYFFGQSREDILDEDEIIGLLGELLFLKKLIKLKGEESLDYWIAERGNEDFVSYGKVVEVKATLKERHEHIINGIDQLIVRQDRVKNILSILFCQSKAEQSISLPRLIRDCEELLSNDMERRDLFYRKLKIRGYHLRDTPKYLNYSYEYIRGGFFKVDDTFPKLTSNELKQPLNSRISMVRYTLDLEGLQIQDFLTQDYILVI